MRERAGTMLGSHLCPPVRLRLERFHVNVHDIFESRHVGKISLSLAQPGRNRSALRQPGKPTASARMKSRPSKRKMEEREKKKETRIKEGQGDKNEGGGERGGERRRDKTQKATRHQPPVTAEGWHRRGRQRDHQARSQPVQATVVSRLGEWTNS